MKGQKDKKLCCDDLDWPEYSKKLARKRIDKENMRTLMELRSQMVAHRVKKGRKKRGSHPKEEPQTLVVCANKTNICRWIKMHVELKPWSAREGPPLLENVGLGSHMGSLFQCLNMFEPLKSL